MVIKDRIRAGAYRTKSLSVGAIIMDIVVWLRGLGLGKYEAAASVSATLRQRLASASNVTPAPEDNRPPSNAAELSPPKEMADRS